MRLLVPTLLLCASALPAADGLDRVARLQEGVQRGVAAQTEQAVAQADLIADDLRFNRLGDEAQADRLDQLAVELAGLVRSPDSERRTMAYVVDSLARAARGEAAALARAATAQGELVGRLDRLAQDAQGRIAAADGVEDLRAAIEAQRRLLQEAGTLSDQTLGKEREDLSATERSDLERLARQQQSLEQALREAAKALREPAQAAEDAREQANLAAAARELEQGQVAREIDRAAAALADNRLAEAQEAQENVLARLEQAERQAAGATSDPLADLDRRMQELATAQREQQRLLDDTRAEQELSRADADRLAARQQDLARDLQAQQQTAAQQAAEQARQELQQQDKAGAEQAMQAALQAMAQAQQQLQQQRQQRQAEQDAQRQQAQQAQQAQQGKPGDQSGGLEQGEPGAKHRSGWQVALEAQDREVLSQVKADSFPARYEQALVQYYRALAGEGEP